MDENILINIHRILVSIRFDIRNLRNVYLVDSVIECISNEKNNEMFIKVLNSELELKNQLIQINGELRENEKGINEFLLVVLNQLKEALQCENYKLAYDLVDMLHILPELMLIDDRKQLKKYWKIYVKSFSKKWKSDLAKSFKHYFV